MDSVVDSRERPVGLQGMSRNNWLVVGTEVNFKLWTREPR